MPNASQTLRSLPDPKGKPPGCQELPLAPGATPHASLCRRRSERRATPSENTDRCLKRQVRSSLALQPPSSLLSPSSPLPIWVSRTNVTLLGIHRSPRGSAVSSGAEEVHGTRDFVQPRRPPCSNPSRSIDDHDDPSERSQGIRVRRRGDERCEQVSVDNCSCRFKLAHIPQIANATLPTSIPSLSSSTIHTEKLARRGPSQPNKLVDMAAWLTSAATASTYLFNSVHNNTHLDDKTYTHYLCWPSRMETPDCVIVYIPTYLRSEHEHERSLLWLADAIASSNTPT
ncbi:hypothetical protein BD410DRAFT_807412 [Rickenella mellea]|uniref:Uncharacterized protein n=1 Tax=Rickenella mellea TaxID=50990 RepID=A0A4Y7PPG1_9AGAM|nr:hypothetical protein BD410DRAFT_810634 [Rickenella mellea]TDL17264.1 hypothetical protein BD410DRAFT_807412 [Rickenella mellea]